MNSMHGMFKYCSISTNLIKNHHHGTANHTQLGTLQYLKRYYYLIEMKDTISNFVTTCEQPDPLSKFSPFYPMELNPIIDICDTLIELFPLFGIYVK